MWQIEERWSNDYEGRCLIPCCYIFPILYPCRVSINQVFQWMLPRTMAKREREREKRKRKRERKKEKEREREGVREKEKEWEREREKRKIYIYI